MRKGSNGCWDLSRLHPEYGNDPGCVGKICSRATILSSLHSHTPGAGRVGGCVNTFEDLNFTGHVKCKQIGPKVDAWTLNVAYMHTRAGSLHCAAGAALNCGCCGPCGCDKKLPSHSEFQCLQSMPCMCGSIVSDGIACLGLTRAAITVMDLGAAPTEPAAH